MWLFPSGGVWNPPINTLLQSFESVADMLKEDNLIMSSNPLPPCPFRPYLVMFPNMEIWRGEQLGQSPPTQSESSFTLATLSPLLLHTYCMIIDVARFVKIEAKSIICILYAAATFKILLPARGNGVV